MFGKLVESLNYFIYSGDKGFFDLDKSEARFILKQLENIQEAIDLYENDDYVELADDMYEILKGGGDNKRV